MPVEEVIRAVNALDLKTFSLENVEILQRMLPTEQEVLPFFFLFFSQKKTIQCCCYLLISAGYLKDYQVLILNGNLIYSILGQSVS